MQNCQNFDFMSKILFDEKFLSKILTNISIQSQAKIGQNCRNFGFVAKILSDKVSRGPLYTLSCFFSTQNLYLQRVLLDRWTFLSFCMGFSKGSENLGGYNRITSRLYFVENLGETLTY